MADVLSQDEIDALLAGLSSGEIDADDMKEANESACQRRGHRFNPWSGKIPHAVKQLTPVPQRLSPCSRVLIHGCQTSIHLIFLKRALKDS